MQLYSVAIPLWIIVVCLPWNYNQIIVDWTTLNTISNMLVAAGALVAILVALFPHKVQDVVGKARLELCNVQRDIHTIRVNQGYHDKEAWVGLTIKNNANRNADNVQVYFTGVKSDVIDDFDKYISIPMITSWVGETRIVSLPSNLPRRWDIFKLEFSSWDSDEGSFVTFHFAGTPINLLDIQLGHSAYFEYIINVVADNAKTSVRIRVDITPTNSREDMADQIKIRVIETRINKSLISAS